MKRTPRARNSAVKPAAPPVDELTDRTPQPRRRRAILWAVLLIVAVLAIYGRATSFQYVHYDDEGYLFTTPYIRHGLTWHGVVAALTEPHLANWHPLTTLTYLADVTLWGLEPGPMHAVNVALHAANAVLLLLLLRRLTARETPCVVVAALFAVHPLHVESVAWIAERKDVLSTLFFLLTIWAYASWTRRRSGWRYALALVLYALGLMSKSMLVTLPCLLLLLDYWPLGRFDANGRGRLWSQFFRRLGRLALEKTPFFALALAASLVTFFMQRDAGAVVFLDALPLDVRLANAAISYLRYLAMMVWPARLAVLYPFQRIELAHGGMAAAAVIAVSAAAFLLRRRAPAVFVGWFWYLGLLVPVIGIVQVGSQSHADRYTYIPLIGIYIAIAWGGAALLSNRARPARMVAAGATIVVIVALGTRAWFQVGWWRNSEMLYRRALVVQPKNPHIHYNLGTMLYEQGCYDEAEPRFREALRLLPELVPAWCNLALNLAAQGRLTEAQAALDVAARRMPDDAEVYNAAAYVAFFRGDLSAAERAAEEALRRAPASPRPNLTMGRVRASQGRLEEAAAHFRRVIEQSGAAQGHAHLALVLARQGKQDQAARAAARALELHRDDPVAHEAMAHVLLSQGKLPEALDHFTVAARTNPNAKDARLQQGKLLARLGRTAEAVAHFRDTVKANPNDAPLRFQLGLLLHQSGDAAGAAEQYRRAIELNPRSAARNNLAWLLATTRQDAARNGAEAVRLAEPLARDGDASAEAFDTLAAAYAEAGDFARAAETARAAADRAAAAGQAALAQQIRERLVTYQKGQAWRE